MLWLADRKPGLRAGSGSSATSSSGSVPVMATLVFALATGCSGLQMEEPPDATESPVETFGIGELGTLEVSGVRPYYDDDYQAHVRAFVTNHSDDQQSAALLVHLRVREATVQAPPIASFTIVLPEPLGPDEGLEVDVPLRALGTLQSLPRWNEMRVDVERLGASQD